MDYTQKKKCGDCRAREHNTFTMSCSLGYKFENINFDGIAVDGKPLEPCPKPLTIKKLLELETGGETK